MINSFKRWKKCLKKDGNQEVKGQQDITVKETFEMSTTQQGSISKTFKVFKEIQRQ